MLASRTLRTIVAAGYFTVLARSLGVSGYGAFAGACALVAILAPFTSLGTGNLLIQAVSRDPSQLVIRWKQCLAVTLLSGAVLSVVVIAIAQIALAGTIPLLLISCIAVADLIFARLIDVAGQAFQAFEQLHFTAALTFGLTGARLLAASALLFFCSHPSPERWSTCYLFSTALPAVLAVWLVHKFLLKTARPYDGEVQRLSALDLREGLHFSIGFAAQTIYNDLDKAMLARLCSLGAAGLYAAAYRIVDAAFSPILSVLAATYARFFQHGVHGLRATTTFAKRLLLRATVYSVCAIVVIWVASPYLPRILGNEFSETIWALRWLSPLILLRAVHYFAADSLTGAGHQRIRTAAQVSVALINAALNFAILPRYSWRGAVVTSLVSDASLALILWIAVFRLRTREIAGTAVNDTALARA